MEECKKAHLDHTSSLPIPVLCPQAPQSALLFRGNPTNLAALCNPVSSTMIGLGLLQGTPSLNPFSITLWTCGP